eukprot:TRINITY_DN70129_c0_g1_i1.p1 TRINITY_DN70129_c0_g1~~TRINITY_DN70129_c0_g1_i1.p1  ORF type:complete len:136 (+),score=14.92 TRINITY_DN70129_c0_g1_i1:103-510(+)
MKSVEDTVESSASAGFEVEEVEGLSPSSLTVSNTVGESFTKTQAQTIGIEKSCQTTQQWGPSDLKHGRFCEYKKYECESCFDVATKSTMLHRNEIDGSCILGYVMFPFSNRPDHCEGCCSAATIITLAEIGKHFV